MLLPLFGERVKENIIDTLFSSTIFLKKLNVYMKLLRLFKLHSLFFTSLQATTNDNTNNRMSSSDRFAPAPLPTKNDNSIGNDNNVIQQQSSEIVSLLSSLQEEFPHATYDECQRFYDCFAIPTKIRRTNTTTVNTTVVVEKLRNYLEWKQSIDADNGFDHVTTTSGTNTDDDNCVLVFDDTDDWNVCVAKARDYLEHRQNGTNGANNLNENMNNDNNNIPSTPPKATTTKPVRKQYNLSPFRKQKEHRRKKEQHQQTMNHTIKNDCSVIVRTDRSSTSSNLSLNDSNQNDDNDDNKHIDGNDAIGTPPPLTTANSDQQHHASYPKCPQPLFVVHSDHISSSSTNEGCTNRIMTDLVGNPILQCLAARIDLDLYCTDTYSNALALYIHRKMCISIHHQSTSSSNIDNNGELQNQNPPHQSQSKYPKFTVLVDVRPGIGWKNLPVTTLIHFIRTCVNCLFYIHPCRLYTCIVYPVPRIAITVWYVIQKLLPQSLSQHIILLSGPANRSSNPPVDQLKQYVSMEAINRMEQNRINSFHHP